MKTNDHYAYGPHGFSTADSSVQSAEGLCDRAQAWVGDSIRWLKNVFGDFGSGCMTKARHGS